MIDYNVTTHFTSSELICKCGCGKISMNPEFISKLEELREWLGRPVYITSGFRCVDHNRAVGGSPRSYHIKGRAVDIVCESSADRYQLLAAAIRLGFGGIGIDKSFVHVDNRSEIVKRIWAY